MNKDVLKDYIDACEYVKETKKEIESLKQNKRIVIDKVKGSNPVWPYEPRSFSIAGTAETYQNVDAIRRETELLEIQKKEAQELKLKVEEWMQTIPFRMKRIIRYRYFEELPWGDVAKKMGRKATGDSVRMEFKNFMKK